MDDFCCRLVCDSAVRVASKAQPDLILLDINMPDVDGYEACRRLKRQASTESGLFGSRIDERRWKIEDQNLGDYLLGADLFGSRMDDRGSSVKRGASVRHVIQDRGFLTTMPS